MIIKIHGKTDKICNAELKFAAAFYAQYLMGNRLAKTLHIAISLSDQGKHTDGRCLPIDLFEKSPRIFGIGINPKMSRAKILQALAHEFVHVKQYVKQELSVEYHTAKFNGKSYRLSESIEDYFNYPWEVEAYGRDRSLYFFYRITVKSEKVVFKRGRVYIDGKMMRYGKVK